MEAHDDDFDSVSWRNDPGSDVSRPTTSGTDAEDTGPSDRDLNGKRRLSIAPEDTQAGPLADPVDLAGIGDGVLECSVDAPLKENDGTKDAYISYLVTTRVSWFRCCLIMGCSCAYNSGFFLSIRQILRPFKNRTLQFADDSVISFSSTKPFTENTRLARSRRSQTNTK